MLINEPQSKFVQLDDLNLHYLEWGSPEKPPIVMLHGWQDTAWLYKRIGRQFADEFHLFSLDLRGHGQTAKEGEPQFQPQAVIIADVEKFLNALDLREVLLVGYSFGGTIAHRLVADSPERIKALVIIDISVENTEATFHPNPDPEKVKISIAKAWERFKRVQVPTLLIMAENSHLLKRDTAEKMLSTIPKGKLAIIENSDHRVFKHPEALAGALRSFVKEL